MWAVDGSAITELCDNLRTLNKSNQISTVVRWKLTRSYASIGVFENEDFIFLLTPRCPHCPDDNAIFFTIFWTSLPAISKYLNNTQDRPSLPATDGGSAWHSWEIPADQQG